MAYFWFIVGSVGFNLVASVAFGLLLALLAFPGGFCGLLSFFFWFYWLRWLCYSGVLALLVFVDIVSLVVLLACWLGQLGPRLLGLLQQWHVAASCHNIYIHL